MKLSEIKKIRRTKNNWTFREVDSLYEAYRRSYFGTSSPPLSPRREPATKPSHTPRYDQTFVINQVVVNDKGEQGVILEVTPNPYNPSPSYKRYRVNFQGKQSVCRGYELKDTVEVTSRKIFSY